jgi:hypothetical protein
MNDVISQYFDEPGQVFEWRGQPWERDSAAESLVNFVASYQFKDGEKLNMVAHSHGGNVVKMYTWFGAARKIDTFVSLGTPQRVDFNMNGTMVGNYFNVYSKHDAIQKIGGVWPYTAAVGAIVGAIVGGGPGAALGALVGASVGQGGRTDPCAVNIGIDNLPGLGHVGHSDLHTPQVWSAMTSWLVRAGHGLHPTGLSYCQNPPPRFGGVEFDLLQNTRHYNGALRLYK